MVAVLMMSAKLASLGLLKIKVFWNKGYDVIISIHDVTNQILSRDSNDIVDAIKWGIEILHQCGKRVKTKSHKVLGANFYVCRSYRGKTG